MSLPDGRRRTFTGSSRDEVRRKLLAAQADRERGLPPADGRTTLGAWLASWLGTIRAEVEDETWRRHRQYVELHIAPRLGRVRLAELTPQQVQALYADRLAAGLSLTTVRHLHATLRKALGDAERVGAVARNVCRLVRAPKMAETEIHLLAAEETRHFLAAVADHRLAALFAVAMGCGLRQSELLGHASVAITLDIYSHVLPDMQQDAAEAMGALLAPPAADHSKETVAPSSS